MENQKSKLLLEKYLKGQCTSEEEAIIETWYFEVSGKQKDNLKEPDYAGLKEEIFNAIKLGNQQQPVKIKSLWVRIAAAAILLISVSAVFFYYKHTVSTPQQIARYDIKPGGNKATLTLSNGKQISLNNALRGKIANQGSTLISKTSEGLVNYKPGSGNTALLAYNEITTPRGGQYSLILSDGTKVTLNAASSIKYPVQFVGANRTVELAGEAYFEVAHNKNKPFIVVSNGQKVEVLGTHFNINSYNDEPGTTTTLLEGSVKVSNQHASKIIKPGQQTYLANNEIIVSTANTTEAIAWKNGYFRFNNESIESIMRELARWYDIDINYDGPSSTIGFYGKISRFKNISQVLHLLEETNGVHFDIEERRVIVKK